MVRLISLIRGLPRDSTLAHEQGVWWDSSHELLATAVEIAHEQLRVALAVGGVRKSKLPKPLHIDRPHQPTPRSRAKSSTPVAQPRRHAQSVADVVAVLNATHRKVGS